MTESDKPVIVADVSGISDKETRVEVHRLGGFQSGERPLPDGSYTGGLGITVCGLEQQTRGHGWSYLDGAGNDYQRAKIASGAWPVCPTCLPEGAPS